MVPSRRFAARAMLLAPVAVAAIALAACTPAPPPQQDSFYRLGAGEPARTFESPALPGTVEVQRLAAAGMSDDRALLYTDDEGRSLRQYSYHFWTDAPTVMLREVLVVTLRAANAAERVVTPDLRVSADYLLSGRLSRLEHRRRDNGDTVLLALEVALRESGRDGFLVMKTYREEADVASADAPAAAAAMQAALESVLARFLDDLAAAQVEM